MVFLLNQLFNKGEINLNYTFGDTKITVRFSENIDPFRGTVAFDCENGEHEFPILFTKNGESYATSSKPMANGKVENPDALIGFLKKKAISILETVEPELKEKTSPETIKKVNKFIDGDL